VLVDVGQGRLRLRRCLLLDPHGRGPNDGIHLVDTLTSGPTIPAGSYRHVLDAADVRTGPTGDTPLLLMSGQLDSFSSSTLAARLAAQQAHAWAPAVTGKPTTSCASQTAPSASATSGPSTPTRHPTPTAVTQRLPISMDMDCVIPPAVGLVTTTGVASPGEGFWRLDGP